MGGKRLHVGVGINPFARNRHRNQHASAVRAMYWTILTCLGLALLTTSFRLASAAPAEATTPPPEDIQVSNAPRADHDRDKRADDNSQTCCNTNVASKCLCFGNVNVITKWTTSSIVLCAKLSGTTMSFSGRCHGEYLPDAMAVFTGSLPPNINKVIIEDMTAVRPGGPLPQALLDRLNSTLTQLTIQNVTGFQTHVASMLRAIPFIKELNISSNNIENLEPNAFANMEDLTVLNLSHNKLRALYGNLFKSNMLLRSIDLSQNEIQLVPAELFSNLTALQDVSLAGNPIGLLTKGLFYSNIGLKTMNFSNTMLRDIGEGIFPSSIIPLQTLDLSENLFWRILSQNLPKVSAEAPPVKVYIQGAFVVKGSNMKIPVSAGKMPKPYEVHLNDSCPCVDKSPMCDGVCNCGNVGEQCSALEHGYGRTCLVDKVNTESQKGRPPAFSTKAIMRTLAEGTMCACLVANYGGPGSRAIEPLAELAGKSYEEVQAFCGSLINPLPRDPASSTVGRGTALAREGCDQLCENDANCEAVTYVDMSASCIVFGDANGIFAPRKWTRPGGLSPTIWARVGSDRSEKVQIEATFRPPVDGQYSFAVPTGARFLIYNEGESGDHADFTSGLSSLSRQVTVTCPEGSGTRCGGLCCPPAFQLLLFYINPSGYKPDFSDPTNAETVWQHLRGPLSDNCRCVNPKLLSFGILPQCRLDISTQPAESTVVETTLGKWVSDSRSIFRYRWYGDYCYDLTDPRLKTDNFSVCRAIGDTNVLGALHTSDGMDTSQVPTCTIPLELGVAYKMRLQLNGPPWAWLDSNLLRPDLSKISADRAHWYNLTCDVPYSFQIFGPVRRRPVQSPLDPYMDVLYPDDAVDDAYVPIPPDVDGQDRVYLARCKSPSRSNYQSKELRLIDIAELNSFRPSSPTSPTDPTGSPTNELPFIFNVAKLTTEFFGYTVVKDNDDFDWTILGTRKDRSLLVSMPSVMEWTSFFDFGGYLTENKPPIMPDVTTSSRTAIVTWGCYAPSEFDEIEPFSGILPRSDSFSTGISLTQSKQKVIVGGTEAHALFFVPPVSVNTHLPTIAVTISGEDGQVFTARGFDQVTGVSVRMPAVGTVLRADLDSLSPTPTWLIVARESNAVHFSLDDCKRTPSACKQFPSAVTVGVVPSSVAWICEETGPSKSRMIGLTTVPTSALGIGVDFTTNTIGAAVGDWDFLNDNVVNCTIESDSSIVVESLAPGAASVFHFNPKVHGSLLVDGIRIAATQYLDVEIVFHDARSGSGGATSTVILTKADSIEYFPTETLYEWLSFVVGDISSLTIKNIGTGTPSLKVMLRGIVTETCHMAAAFDVARFDEERFEDGYLAIHNVTITLPFVQTDNGPAPTLPTTLIARDYTGLVGSQFGDDLTVDIATAFGHGIANKMGNRFCELKRNDELAAYVCDLAASKDLSDTIKTWMRGAQARVIFSPAAFQLNKNVEIPARATANGVLWNGVQDLFSKLALTIHYEVYRWAVTADWAPACPTTTTQTRIVLCVNRANATVDPTNCAALHRPADAQSCGANGAPSQFLWHSLCYCPCAAEACGTVTDEPMVFCINSAMNMTVDEGLCAGLEKSGIVTCGKQCKCDVGCSGCWSALPISGDAGQCTKDTSSSVTVYSRAQDLTCNLCKGPTVVFANVNKAYCQAPAPPSRVTCSPTEVLTTDALWGELQSLRIVQISADRSTKEMEILLGVPAMAARQALAEAEAGIAEAQLRILSSNSSTSMKVPVAEAEAALATAKVETLRQSKTLLSGLVEQSIVADLAEAHTRERQALAGLVQPLAGKTLPRIEVLGAGYNLVRANPHCTDDPFGMGGIVPLVDLSYTSMAFVGDKFLPDGVYATQLTSADFNSDMEILTSESELRESAMLGIKFSTEEDSAEEISSQKNAFSLNSQFSTESENMRSSKDVFVRNKVTVTVARMNLLPNFANIARPSAALLDYWRSISIDDDCCLSEITTDCNSNCNALERMPDVFGTHLMKAVTLGCIGMQQLQLDVVEVKSLVENDMSADAAASSEETEGKPSAGLGVTTKVSTDVSVALKKAMQSSSSSTKQKIQERYLGGIPQPGGFFDDGQVNNDALKTYAGTCSENPFITDYTLMRVDEFVEQMGPSKFDEDREVFAAKLKKFRIIMREYCAGIVNCAPDARDADRIDPVMFNDIARFTYTHSDTRLFTLTTIPDNIEKVDNVRITSDISGTKDSMIDLSPDDEVCFPAVTGEYNDWVNDPDILDFPGMAWWLSDSPQFPGCHGSLCAGEFRMLRVVPTATTYDACRQACQDTSTCVAGTFVSNPSSGTPSGDTYHFAVAQCVLFLNSLLTENTILHAWNFDNHLGWRQHWRGRLISWRCGVVPIRPWDAYGLRSFRKHYADGDNTKENSLFRITYPVEKHIEISDKTLRYGKGFTLASKTGCLSEVKQDPVKLLYRWSVTNVKSSSNSSAPRCIIFRFLSRVLPIGSVVSYADSVFIEASTNFTINPENFIFNRRPSLFVAPADANGALSTVHIIAENSPGSDLQSFSWSISRGASLSVSQSIGEGTTSEYGFEASASVEQSLTSAIVTIEFTIPVSRVSIPVAFAAAVKRIGKESIATYALRLIKSDFVITVRRLPETSESDSTTTDEAPASMLLVPGRQSDDVYVVNVTFASQLRPRDTLFVSLSAPDNIVGIRGKQVASVVAKSPVIVITNMPTTIWAVLSCQILDPVTKNVTVIGRLHFSQLIMNDEKDRVSPSDFSVYRDNKLANYVFDIHSRDAGVAMSPDDTITPLASSTFSFSVSIPDGINISSITIGVDSGRVFTLELTPFPSSARASIQSASASPLKGCIMGAGKAWYASDTSDGDGAGKVPITPQPKEPAPNPAPVDKGKELVQLAEVQQLVNDVVSSKTANLESQTKAWSGAATVGAIMGGLSFVALVIGGIMTYRYRWAVKRMIQRETRFMVGNAADIVTYENSGFAPETHNPLRTMSTDNREPSPAPAPSASTDADRDSDGL